MHTTGPDEPDQLFEDVRRVLAGEAPLFVVNREKLLTFPRFFLSLRLRIDACSSTVVACFVPGSAACGAAYVSMIEYE